MSSTSLPRRSSLRSYFPVFVKDDGRQQTIPKELIAAHPQQFADLTASREMADLVAAGSTPIGSFTDVARFRDLVDSFFDPPRQLLIPQDEQIGITLVDIYQNAKLVKDMVDKTMMHLLYDLHLDPNARVQVGGRDLEGDYKRYIEEQIMGYEELKEEVNTKYEGDASRCLNLVRAATLFETESQLDHFMSEVLVNGEEYYGIRVLRLKNRFEDPLINGNRFFLCDLVFNCRGAQVEGYVFQLQCHLAPIFKLEKESRKFFQFFQNLIDEKLAAEKEAADGGIERMMEKAALSAKQKLHITTTLAEDFERWTMSELCKKSWAQLSSFVSCQRRLAKIANAILTEGLMGWKRFTSFANPDLMQPVDEDDPVTMDFFRGLALLVKSEFDEKMRGIVSAALMSPDDFPKVGGKVVLLRDANRFSNACYTFLTLQEDIMLEEECVERVNAVGSIRRVVDMVKCRVVCETEKQVAAVVGKMLSIEGFVVGMANNFFKPLFTGLRECVLHVVVDKHICQVIVHLAAFLEVHRELELEKLAAHFEDFFESSDESTEENQETLELLAGIGEEELNIREALGSSDEKVLQVLAEASALEILGGDEELGLLAYQRLHEIAAGKGDGLRACRWAFKIGQAFHNKDDFEEALVQYSLALEGYEDFEVCNTEYLEVIYSLGALYEDRGELHKALPVFEKAKAAVAKILGEHDESFSMVTEKINDVKARLGRQ